MSRKTPWRECYALEDRGHETPCWIWQGYITNNGYGRLVDKKKSIFAHRAMYEEHVGEIPDGLTIDHLCRVRPCCNPHHLEVVPRGENARRGQLAVGGTPRGKLWETGDIHRLRVLATAGFSDHEIARLLDRTRKAVQGARLELTDIRRVHIGPHAATKVAAAAPPAIKQEEESE